MLKRLLVTLGILAGLISPVHAAGTIPYSLSQQIDSSGKPLAGCLLYTIQAGTTSTPQNGYQDSALSIALPNPIVCDAAGRLPQMFFADGTIKVRLTDKNGVTQVVADGIQVVGASSGSGGGGSVDPTTIAATGDLKVRYGTGTLSGFVRANGRTIGSATSGASERANADTQALFEYLWGADANLTVSGGRGASANADWVANKTLTLPDFRGRTIAALDDMGNTASGRRTTTYSGVDATTLGSATTTVESRTLTEAQLPALTKSLSLSVSASTTAQFPGGNFAVVSSGDVLVPAASSFTNGGVTVSASGTVSFGSGSAHSIIDPTIFITTYLKL